MNEIEIKKRFISNQINEKFKSPPFTVIDNTIQFGDYTFVIDNNANVTLSGPPSYDFDMLDKIRLSASIVQAGDLTLTPKRESRNDDDKKPPPIKKVKRALPFDDSDFNEPGTFKPYESDQVKMMKRLDEKLDRILVLLEKKP